MTFAKNSIMAALYLPLAHAPFQKDYITGQRITQIIPGKHVYNVIDFYNSPYSQYTDLTKLREVCCSLAVIIFMLSHYERNKSIFNIYLPTYIQRQSDDLQKRVDSNQRVASAIDWKPLKILTINCLARLSQLAFPNAEYLTLIEKSKNIVLQNSSFGSLDVILNGAADRLAFARSLSQFFQNTDILPITETAVHLHENDTPNLDRGLFKRRFRKILTAGIDQCIQEDGTFFDLFIHPEPVNFEETDSKFFKDLWRKNCFPIDIQTAMLVMSTMHENFHAIMNYHYFALNNVSAVTKAPDASNEIFSLLYYMENAMDIYIDQFPTEKKLAYPLSLEEHYANIFSIEALKIMAEQSAGIDLDINSVKYINSRLTPFGMVLFERPISSALRPISIGQKKKL